MSSFFPGTESSEAVKKLRVQSFSTSSVAEGRESISKPAGCLARLWDLAPPMWALASSFVSEDFEGCHMVAQQEAEPGEQHVFCFCLFPLGHIVVLTKRYSSHSKPQLHPPECVVPQEYSA